MKKGLLCFVCLLAINSAFGLTVKISPQQTRVGLNDNLTINYEINLDIEELVNYTIIISNKDHQYTILNETNIATPITNSIKYNVSTITAGEYQLILTINSKTFPNLVVRSQDNVTIAKLTSFEIEDLNRIYATNLETQKKLLIENNGNTEINFAVYFTNAESEITVSPQTFSIRAGKNKTIIISVKRPKKSYDATLHVIGTYEDVSTSVERNISIITPYVILNVSDVNITNIENSTKVTFLMENYGNMDVNYTIKIRSFDFSSGFKTISRKGIALMNTTNEVTYFLNKTKVTGMTIYYNNGTADVELKLKLSIFDMPFDVKLSPDKALLAIIVILIIGFVVWNKLFRKKRP